MVNSFLAYHNKQNPYQDYQQDDLGVHQRISNASTRRPMGLSKFAQICHRIWALYLVYGMEVMSPAKVMIHSLRVMQAQKREKEKEVFAVERREDLEGLGKKREEA